MRIRPVESVKMVTVIEVVSLRGDGSLDYPVRRFVQYFDTNGKLLAERDTLGE